MSFLAADIMSFYEQQSSFNPNMPMRFLIFAGMAYAKYIQPFRFTGTVSLFACKKTHLDRLRGVLSCLVLAACIWSLWVCLSMSKKIPKVISVRKVVLWHFARRYLSVPPLSDTGLPPG